MRIRTQLHVTMLLFGVILAVIAISAIVTNRQAEKSLGQATIADNIAQGASELSYLSNDYLIYGERQQLARWRSRFAAFSAELVRLAVGSPEQQALVRRIQTSRQMLEEVFDSAASARKGTFDPEFLQVSWSRMAIQTQSLISDASRLSQLLHFQANRLKRINIVVVFTMIGIFSAYFLANYLLIQRRTLQSLATLQAGTAVIGSGNLEFAIEEKRSDEIGDLSRAFNRMAANLKDMTTSKTELEREIVERKRAEHSLRKAQAAAEEANRAKSEFLANMSHEIRTPMTVFLAALEHLLQIDGDPERRLLLEMAEQSGQRLRALIDDILDFSKIEARRVDIEEESFDLRACVRDAVAMMRIKAGEKKLNLQMDVASGIPPLIFGDPNRLGQVLINLVANAVKFTLAGEVRVSVRPRGKTLEFAVSDTGIGIPVEKRDMLFQSFSQVDGSPTRKYGGTGLGLAISKGLVELMGGEIGMRSREGGGSVFFFTLPLRPAAQPGSAPESTPAEGRSALEACQREECVQMPVPAS